MKTLSLGKNEPFHIELKRDECKVIARRGADPDALKRAHAKMRRILKKMPIEKGDTLAELEASRETRGRV